MVLLGRLRSRLREVLAERGRTHDPGPYPVSVKPRDIPGEEIPPLGGVETFDSEAATQLNRARLQHLASLALPIDGKSVLDLGCGVGHLAHFFTERGCRVVCVDGRETNITRLRTLHPGLDAHVVDLESEAFDNLGQFDIVFCYGLLYHLQSPFLLIRKVSGMCREMLLIETMVCDSELPLVRYEDETKTVSQALRGVGCRPSPSFVTMALCRSGFAHVYAPKSPPAHPDFRFSWTDKLEAWKARQPLRCIFVASRSLLVNDRLYPLVSPQ